jgi:hypothetical protein
MRRRALAVNPGTVSGRRLQRRRGLDLESCHEWEHRFLWHVLTGIAKRGDMAFDRLSGGCDGFVKRVSLGDTAWQRRHHHRIRYFNWVDQHGIPQGRHGVVLHKRSMN